MKRWILEFDASDKWNPLFDNSCWVHCPFTCFIKLNETCRCKEIYERDGINLCPVYKYGKAIIKDNGDNI